MLMPTGLNKIPAGGFAVKGASLYMERNNKLVLVAVDRGGTWSCAENGCAEDGWNAGAEHGRCYPWLTEYDSCRVCTAPQKKCTTTDASVQACTSSLAVAAGAWASVTVAVTPTSAVLYVGAAEACSVSLPHGLLIDENDVPLYTQCRGDGCGTAEARRAGTRWKDIDDHSFVGASPHFPSAASADFYDFTVQFGPAAVDAAPLAAALAARAAFAPPAPDAWKKRCRPDCPDPNVFSNHVPIPQGRWSKIPDPRSLQLFGCREIPGSICEPISECVMAAPSTGIAALTRQAPTELTER
jgi:hypothetical protein